MPFGAAGAALVLRRLLRVPDPRPFRAPLSRLPLNERVARTPQLVSIICSVT